MLAPVSSDVSEPVGCAGAVLVFSLVLVEALMLSLTLADVLVLMEVLSLADSLSLTCPLAEVLSFDSDSLGVTDSLSES